MVECFKRSTIVCLVLVECTIIVLLCQQRVFMVTDNDIYIYIYKIKKSPAKDLCTVWPKRMTLGHKLAEQAPLNWSAWAYKVQPSKVSSAGPGSKFHVFFLLTVWGPSPAQNRNIWDPWALGERNMQSPNTQREFTYLISAMQKQNETQSLL